MARKYNHTLKDNSLNYQTNAGSRRRLRIPVAGVRKIGVKPGDRVNVRYNQMLGVVEVYKQAYGRYKVEKDGGIRFFTNLIPSDNVHMKADELSGTVYFSASV